MSLLFLKDIEGDDQKDTNIFTPCVMCSDSLVLKELKLIYLWGDNNHSALGIKKA